MMISICSKRNKDVHSTSKGGRVHGQEELAMLNCVDEFVSFMWPS